MVQALLADFPSIVMGGVVSAPRILVHIGYSPFMTFVSRNNNSQLWGVMTLVIGLFCLSGLAVRAETTGLERQFAELKDPDYQGWARAAAEIRMAWSRSGSATADLLLKRGEAALDAGDGGTAVEHLTALTDHAPDFPEGYFARANAYMMTGDYGPALADLRRALDLEPRHWGALAALGSLLEEMDDRPRALAAFRASFALNPHQQDVKDAINRLEQELAGVAL